MKKKHRRVTIEIGWWEDDKGFETGVNDVFNMALRTGGSVVKTSDFTDEYEVKR